MTPRPAGGAPVEAAEELAAVDEEPPGSVTAERQALLDERAFLLRSLRDLEEERDAGDLDPVDYEALRSRYTARAAAVLRALAGPVPPAGPASDAPIPGATSGAAGAAIAVQPTGGASTESGAPSPVAAGSGRAGAPGPVAAGGGRAGAPDPTAAMPSDLLARRRRRRRWLVGGAVACFAAAAVVVVVGALGIGLPGNPVTGSLTLTRQQQVQRLLAQGETALLQNDSVTALAAFDQALAIDPTQPEALSEAGWLQFAAGVRAHNRTLVRQGQDDEQKAVADAPASAGARFYLAAMLAQEGSTQQSVTQFEAALNDKPTDATVAAFASTIDQAFGRAHVPVPASVGQAVAAEQAAGPHAPAPAGAAPAGG